MRFICTFLSLALAASSLLAQEQSIPAPAAEPAPPGAATVPPAEASDAFSTTLSTDPALPDPAGSPAAPPPLLQVPQPLRMEEALRVQHVNGNIYLLQGKGGNIAVSAGPDGFLLVDSEYASDAKKVLEALSVLGKSEVKYLINTHWHRDHTEGNAVLGASATIIAHRAVRPRLERAGYPPEALPDEEFEHLKELHFNGEDVRIIHASGGHTDGDSIVFFLQSRVLHMGDLFFAGRFPLVDLDAGGGVERYIGNVREILAQVPEDVLIVPGHGPLASKQDLHDFLDMLVATRDIVQKQRVEGYSVKRIVAGGLPQPWPAWGWDLLSTDDYIRLLFRGLEEDRPGMPAAAGAAPPGFPVELGPE